MNRRIEKKGGGAGDGQCSVAFILNESAKQKQNKKKIELKKQNNDNNHIK